MTKFAAVVGVLLAVAGVYADDPPLISGQISVFGSRITVSPSIIETPAGIPVFINTTGNGISGVLKGELRGPTISGALTFETLPGQPFQLPGLSTQGTYFFEDIRLMNNDQVVSLATPDRVEIRVIELLITSLSSRPLTLDEIRALGIVINENDFSAVSFNVALSFNSQQIQINFPLLLPKRDGLRPIIPPPINGVGFIGPTPPAGPGGLPIALPNMVPVEFKPTSPDFDFSLPDIPGILVFPNEIAFLNQFFSVMLMVRNGASEGSELVINDLTAQTVLDPENVELVRTTPIVPLGSPVPVRVPGADGIIGTGDDLELIVAGQTAQAEFFVEGLKEGTHTVRMALNGTLQGLAQGDVPISGTATGAILVRNPNFSLTFSHPSVVRAHEEYDLFVTITNTSTVDANLVRLTIPINALVNCKLKSDPFQEFEVIASGESATAKFRIEPLVTGQVNAAVITGSGNVNGKFEFRIGVGEEGIPLSPNTLVLPEYAGAFGLELLERGLSFLGLGYSAATAPPGSLPPGLPYISKSAVFQRAIEIAQAGQRFQLGENKNTSLSHLLLDLLGNSAPDQPIDQLRRTTQKGRLLFDEIIRQINLGAGNATAQHNDFADETFFRNPYLSVMLSSSGSTPNLTITDSINQTLSSTGGEFGPFLGIPYGDILRTEDESVHWGIIGSIPTDFPVSHFYLIRIAGNDASQSLNIIVPFGQDSYTAEFGNFSTVTGTTYTLLIDQQALNNGVLELKDPLGVVVASANLNQVNSTQTSIIAVKQDAKADKTGHLIAVLFNRPITQTSAQTLSNYFVEKNTTVDAKLQSGGRIVYLAFANPISPLIDNDLEVSDIDPPLSGGNVTVPIETTASTDAGRVTGKVIGSDGTPIAFASVQLFERDEDDLLGGITQHVSAATTTSAQGEYEFDYVRKLNRAFEVRVQDPVTGEIASVSSIITQAQQLLRVDVVFLGRGTVQGIVYKLDGGNVVPVSGAVVQAVSLNEQITRSALSDSQGRYAIPDIAVGNVNLTAQNQVIGEPEPYFGATSVAIEAAGSIVNADIEVVSTEAGKVSGRILQANAVDPIINAYVLLTMDVGGGFPLMLATYSNEEGWYEFDPIPEGLAQISAQDTATGQTIGSTSINVPAGGDVTANIIAQGTGNIEIFLVLAQGMNLSDVGVYVQGTAFNQNPVQSSPVRFEGLSVGTWRVLAINQATGQSISGNVTIPYASATGSIILRFPERGTIGGQILNVDTSPAANSTVLLFGGILQSHLTAITTADSQGNYLFTDVDFNSFGYRAHAISADQNDGGESQVVVITEQNRNATANVTFYGKGTIDVHVETSAGPTVVSVRLDTVTFDSDGRIRREISYHKNTNIEGNTSFTNIFRRPFRVVVTTPGTAPAIVSGELTGPSKQVNILLSDNPSVSGVVHDANGTPVQAQVTYEAESGTQMLTTDPQGQFTFTNLPAGEAVFTASALGSLGQVRIFVQPSNPLIDIHLLGFGSVFGMVQDGSGNPVTGADIKLTVPGLLARTLLSETDENGMYRFDNVPEEFIAVEATNGISGGRAGAKIIHNAEISLDITLTSTGTVEGTVFKANGNTRIPNATVSLFRKGGGDPVGVAASDANGNFQFLFVPVGSYRIAAIDNTTGRRGQSASFSITTNGETVDQDVLMEGQGSVRGFVYDYSGSNAISGARIVLVSQGLVVRTLLGSSSTDGSFEFPAVPQGTYTITATSDLLAGQVEGSIEVDEQEVEETILLQASASIEGTILFADQTPLPAGVVPIIDLTGIGINLRIDAPQGQFNVSDLPLGDYTLTTRFTYNSIPYRGIARISLSNPGVNGLTLVLKGLKTVNVTIQGSVLDVTTVTLTYSNDMERRKETRIINTNFTSYVYVPESSFTVTVRSEDTSSGAVLAGSGSGTIIGDGPPAVDLVVALAPSGTVEGVVADVQSNPIDNISLTLTAGSTNLFAFSDVAGNFSIHGVPPGSYTLIAEDFAGDRRARAAGVVADGQTNTHTLVLDGSVPSIVSTTPTAGAQEVPADSTIDIVFSELMEPATVQSAFLLSSSGGTVSGALVANGANWTFTPSTQLEPQRTYSIIIDAGAEDLAGNSLGQDFIASFTTIDTVNPTLSNSLPVHMAFNVPLNTNLQLFFSESIQTSGTYTIDRNPAGPPLTIASETWNPARTSVTLTFNGPLVENERITFSITGFTDTSGNSNSAIIFFDTIDTMPPSDPALTPSANPIREGTPVTITAAISESLVNVDFFINGVLRFHDTAEPFVYNVPASLTTIAANGGTTMLVEASATDRSGNTSTRTALPITLIPDAPPEISINPVPAPGDIHAGQTIRVNFSALDDGDVTQVLITLSGAYNTSFATSSDSGFKDFELPTWIVNGSTLFVKGRATDDTGKSTAAADAVYTIVPDVTPPTITITQPSGGTATVTEGESFTVAANASDNVKLSRIVFSFNGTQVIDNFPPFQTSFTAPAVEDDSTIIGTGTAFDVADNSSEAQFTITVQSSDDPDLPTVEFICPSNGSLFPVDHTLALSVHATDNANVQKVELYRDDEQTPFHVSDNISSPDTNVNSTDSLAGLTVGATRQYRAVVYDYTGNSSQKIVTVEIVAGNNITTNEVISSSNPYQDETIIVYGGTTLTINGSHSFGDIVVLNGGIINHSDTNSTTEFKMHLNANRVYLACGGKIDVTGRGYDKNYTYPNTTVGGTTGTSSGGSHGGLGLKSGSDFVASTYGSFVDPQDSGSGGAAASGGGSVWLAMGALTIDGNILVDGSGTNGGGAGGAIQVNTQTITGSGMLSAKGGRAGGGGRISVFYDQDQMNGGIVKHLRAHGQDSGVIAGAAGAGTIYLFETNASTYGTLVVDNTLANDAPSRETILPAVETGVVLNTASNVVTCQGDAPGWTAFPHSVAGLYFRVLNPDDSTFGEFKILSQSGNSLTLEDLSDDITGLRYRGVLKMDSIEVRGGAKLITPDLENDQPPSVSITSPVSGTGVFEGQSIQVAIDAFDDSGINEVRLFVNDVSHSADTTFPYVLAYGAPFGTAGNTVTIFARATDNTGHITDSQGILINILDDLPPVITLSSPQEAETFNEGSQMPVVFTITDDFDDLITPAQVDLTINGVNLTPQLTINGSNFIFSYDYRVPYGLTTLTIEVRAQDDRNQESIVQRLITVNDVPDGPARIGSLNLGVTPTDIAVDGNYAYITAGVSGLIVIDISVPDSPVVVGSLAIPGNVSNVAVSENYVYAVNSHSGAGNLQVIDVTDPATPQLVGSISGLGTFAQDVAISENRAYVCSSGTGPSDFGPKGFFIIDVANPTSPVLLGSLTTTTYRKVKITGNLAVTTSSSGFRTIDVSNPSAPVVLATRSYGFAGAALQDPLAYIGSGNVFRVIDLTTSNNPLELGNFQDQLIDIGDVGFDDSIPVISIRNGIGVIDVQTPADPILDSILLFEPLTDSISGSDIAAQGDYAYSIWDTRLLISRYRSPSDAGGIEPVVSITSPQNGASVPELSTLPITVDATDDIGVESVEFLINGVPTFTDVVPPYVYNFPVPVGEGTLTLGARARDFAGNIGTGTTITVEIVGEQTAPIVSITSPEDGSTVAENTSLNVTVDATDNVAVASVTLLVDGQPEGTDLEAPYEFLITVPTGIPTTVLTAEAFDTESNSATSGPVTLNIATATVQLVTPNNGQPLEQGAEIYMMATAISAADFSDYYFLVNGIRINPLPAVKQGDLLRFIAPFTVPATDTIQIEAVAVAGSFTTGQTIQCLGKKRPDPFRILYSLPADGESQVVFNNDWTSPSITVKFSQPLNEAQDFTNKVDLLENGVAIPVIVSASSDILQIQATFISAASYALTVQNVESSNAELLTVPFSSTFTTGTNIIYVDQNDPGALSDPPCGSISTAPCSTISAAVLSAQVNDAILINSGDYSEDISVPGNISLNGADSNTVNVAITQTTFGQSASDRLTVRNLGMTSNFSSYDVTNIYLSNVQIQFDGESIPAVDILDTTGNPGKISILNSQITASGTIDSAGIVLNLSGNESTRIHIADSQITASSLIGIYLADLDHSGGIRARLERNQIMALVGIQSGESSADVIENQITGSDAINASGMFLAQARNYVFGNTIRGELSTGISSDSFDFLSNNDISGTSGLGTTDAILYQNSVHDSQIDPFGIVSYRGQVISNNVINLPNSGGYLVDNVVANNTFRKLGGAGIQQGSQDFGFFEFNHMEACASEAVFVDAVYGDYGGGFFGSRGGNVFLNNGLNFGNPLEITIDARNNAWDILPPDGTFGPLNTDPATLISSESDQPAVEFVTPTDGQDVSANQDLIVEISTTDATGVALLGVSIDFGTVIYQSIEPYRVLIPASALTPGSHSLTVEVVDVWNNQTTQTITVNAN